MPNKNGIAAACSNGSLFQMHITSVYKGLCGRAASQKPATLLVASVRHQVGNIGSHCMPPYSLSERFSPLLLVSLAFLSFSSL